jgi:hypothetical protein
MPTPITPIVAERPSSLNVGHPIAWFVTAIAATDRILTMLVPYQRRFRATAVPALLSVVPRRLIGDEPIAAGTTYL